MTIRLPAVQNTPTNSPAGHSNPAICKDSKVSQLTLDAMSTADQLPPASVWLAKLLCHTLLIGFQSMHLSLEFN